MVTRSNNRNKAYGPPVQPGASVPGYEFTPQALYHGQRIRPQISGRIRITMNIKMLIDFVTGKYDHPKKQAETQAKIEQARINKPQTVRVQKNLDFIIREENDDIEEVKHRRRSVEEILNGQTIDSPLGIRGITRDKLDDRWSVRVRCGVKQYHIGVFDELEDAVRVRDKVYADVQNGTFVHDTTYHKRVRQARSERKLPPNVYNAVNGRYSGKIMIKGAMYFLGTFDTIEETVEAVKLHKEKFNGK